MPTEARTGTWMCTTHCPGSEEPAPPLPPEQGQKSAETGPAKTRVGTRVLGMSGSGRKALTSPRPRRSQTEGHQTASRHKGQGDREATIS